MTFGITLKIVKKCRRRLLASRKKAAFSFYMTIENSYSTDEIYALFY